MLSKGERIVVLWLAWRRLAGHEDVSDKEIQNSINGYKSVKEKILDEDLFYWEKEFEQIKSKIR